MELHGQLVDRNVSIAINREFYHVKAIVVQHCNLRVPESLSHSPVVVIDRQG